MNRKLLIAALSGALLIAQNALAIDAPKGWKATTASDGTVYTPTDAKENSVSLVISPPLPDEGKTAGKDAVQGKNTYPALLGLDASRAALAEHSARAQAAAAHLPHGAPQLQALLARISQRSH